MFVCFWLIRSRVFASCLGRNLYIKSPCDVQNDLTEAASVFVVVALILWGFVFLMTSLLVLDNDKENLNFFVLDARFYDDFISDVSLLFQSK